MLSAQMKEEGMQLVVRGDGWHGGPCKMRSVLEWILNTYQRILISQK